MYVEKLLADGAEVVGGVVFLNRVALGSFQPEGFVLNEAGKAHFQTETVVDVVEEAAEPARRGRKPKADAE